MFCQIWESLKAIVSIPYFIVDLRLDASILGFLKSLRQSFVYNILFIVSGDLKTLKRFKKDLKTI